jgi:RNA polymerase sigma-70 factor (ECF subfamily)
MNSVIPVTAGPSFDALLAAAQAGEDWARARIYEWLAPAVAGYARAQGAPDPADLTSDVFVAVLTRLPTFSGDEAHFRSWVFTIAYRRIADTRRRRDRSLPPPAASPSAEDVTLTRLSGQRVEALLATLTPDQRQVLALRVIADLSLEQVAAIVGKPVGAVKALQHRALATLRRSVVGEAVSP